VAFSPGMGELNTSDTALRVDEPNDFLKRLEMRLAPHAHILRRDPSLRSHRGRFRKDEACSADGAAAKMHIVPLIRKAVRAGVLAHRRNADTVREDSTPQTKFAKQVRHGLFLSHLIWSNSCHLAKAGEPYGSCLAARPEIMLCGSLQGR
jgi:hypothetical protein